MKVLVVDDSKTMRMIIGSVLSQLGHEFSEAANGKEGLQALTARREIELALVDWNMPEMNGLELVQAVRADPSLKALKLMMITTEGETANVQKALAAGANEYLTKPFTADALQAKLRALGMGGEPMPSPAAAAPLAPVPHGILIEIMRKIFGTMVPLALAASDGKDPAALARANVVAFVSISGPSLRYVMSLQMTEKLACRISGAMTGKPIEDYTEDAGDSVGEVANMAAGNYKASLGIAGLILSMPSVLQVSDNRAAGETPVCEQRFTCESEPLLVRVIQKTPVN